MVFSSEINQKSKDTLLSQTIKIEENKMSLFFGFMAQGPSYWHFLPQGVGVVFAATVANPISTLI